MLAVLRPLGRRFAQVVDYGPGGSDGLGMAAQPKPVEVRDAKLFAQHSFGIVGTEHPLLDTRFDRIAQFQNLGDDWDGCGAKAPSYELLVSAVGLACVFRDQGVPAPSRVVPGLNATVLVEWQFQDGGYAEVEVTRPFFAEVMLIEPGEPAVHWTLPTD